MRKHVRNRVTFAARSLMQVAVALTAVVGSFTAAMATEEDNGSRRWLATWGASPMQPGTAFSPSRSFENQTIRQIVHTSIGGAYVRVRLSNQYGPGDLIVGSAHVALMSSGDSIVPTSDRVLTFRGQSTVTIPVGSSIVSDPVNLVVGNNGDLAISLYVPQNTGEAMRAPVTVSPIHVPLSRSV